LVGLVLMLVTPIVGMLIQFAISRQREFLADASAATLTRNPKGLMNALMKLERGNIPLATADISTSHLFITNPFGDMSMLSNLFSTHPPISERIERLSHMS
jgi:heat shock protein HtpX